MPRLVRVNEHGLAIPPKRLDCLGDDCPVAETVGRCFVDEHHLYFPEDKFCKDALTAVFSRHSFNRIDLPRCQHNSASSLALHSQYDGTPIPRKEIMERFLEEAHLLKMLGVVWSRADGLLKSMSSEEPYDEPTSPVEELASHRKLRRRLEQWYESEELKRELLVRAQQECEVVIPILRKQKQAGDNHINHVLERAS